MHSDLVEKMIARRMRAAADASSEAPYDFTEFRRRRRARSRPTAFVGRDRSLAVAASVIAALLVTGVAIVRSRHQYTPPAPMGDGAAHASLSRRGVPAREAAQSGRGQKRPDRLVQARTRVIEGWLAALPHDPAMVRVGEHAAVTSLQDQIAALDDLMSAERVAGAQPGRLGALERQRAQLVSSLAQLQYAEMLASASP
jgi:hypothetical protein